MTTLAPSAAPALRRLYLVRFGFAVVWAILLTSTGADLNPVSVGLLVLYPVFDVAAAVVDLRSSRTSTLAVNAAVSALAAVGLAVAAAAGVPAVLRVWGAWAIVSGLVQLVVGVRRRALGGQVPMMLAGGISVLAGASFAAMAGADDPAVAGVAGYAAVGGVFFLVSALRLGRAARGN
ncbi:hypothetical protein CryarDRAFT_2274 [Cryptosporangium arvum DSM 44712]|uniref:Integral membrane protein n=1 Tax=Cryptosporangium arvum DSM 44712 TaxID=927661 RepID=A0A010ZVD1_9ACTN|nr:hypothetical protein [Cryptosporangium arvum]EXG81167.1 hypothetical protein CryarDRAFT_2274 [Cryptosporangium arvum DSM 44712]